MQPVALDTETTLITAEEPTGRLVCASYAFEGGKGVVGRADGVELFRRCLKDPDVDITGQNISYDFRVAIRQDPSIEPLVWAAYDAGRVYDTMIAAQLDEIRRGYYIGARKGFYSLEGLADRYLGEKLEKEDTYRLRYGELEGYNPEEWKDLMVSRLRQPTSAADIAHAEAEAQRAIDYPIADADTTLRTRLKIGEIPDLRRQTAHAWWLDLVSTEGFDTDPKAVETLLRNTVDEAAKLAKVLLDHSLIRFDKDGVHRNVKITQDYAVGKGVVKRTKGGGVSLDAEACEDSGDPVLLAYARFGQLLDIINKDSEYLKLPTVRARYGLAETGRTTCWGPNMQNLKVFAGIRECFVPPPGFYIAGADYEGLELCTMAQVCLKVLGKSKLAEMLNAGIDVHTWMACQILGGIDYEEGKRRKAAGKKKDPEFYFARQCAKAADFGLPGGMGWRGFIGYAKSNYGVELSPSKSQDICAKWIQTFPEFTSYFDMVRSLPHHYEKIKDKRTGDLREVPMYEVEQLYSGRVSGRVLFTEAANRLFQGLGGDATKAAGYELTKACRIGSGALRGGHPLVFVHDEFLAKVRQEVAHEAAHELADTMVKAATVFLPDVPPKALPYLCKRWDKGADTVYKNGRLIPFEDRDL